MDDLPDTYAFKREVVVWESQFWERPLAPRLFDAPIDTTFALYRRPQPRGFERSLEFMSSMRTGYPYVARHTPWYVDDNFLSEDEAYNRSRAEGSDVNHWSRDALPDWIAEAVAARELGTAARTIAGAKLSYSERVRRLYRSYAAKCRSAPVSPDMTTDRSDNVADGDMDVA